MPSEISVHDNFLLSYTVECQERRITLCTAFYDSEPHERTNILFSGVVVYHFERDNFSTILFDVHEVSVEQVYVTYRDEFERSKNYGWPKIRYNTEAELMAELHAQAIKGFLIASSYGMEGFVLAQEMRLIAENLPLSPALEAKVTRDEA